MNKNLFFLLALTLIFSRAPQARAENLSLNQKIWPPSIYKISPLTDGLIIGSTALLTVTAYAFRYSLINRRCPCDPNEVNSFDRYAIYNQSDLARSAAAITVGASLITPIAVDYLDIGTSRAFKEDMVVYAETMTVNWFLVNTVKFAAQRPLPRLYAAQTQGTPGDYLAFYSGHTSTVVSALAAMSMTYTYRHGFSIWPWLATGLLGASVGYEMVASAGHFPSDVIVGFIAGGAVGWAVPYFHAKKADGSDQGLSIIPTEFGPLAFWHKNF